MPDIELIAKDLAQFSREYIYRGRQGGMDRRRIAAAVTDMLLEGKAATVNEVFWIEPAVFDALRATDLCGREIPQERTPRGVKIELTIHQLDAGGKPQASYDPPGPKHMQIAELILDTLKGMSYGPHDRGSDSREELDRNVRPQAEPTRRLASIRPSRCSARSR